MSSRFHFLQKLQGLLLLAKTLKRNNKRVHKGISQKLAMYENVLKLIICSLWRKIWISCIRGRSPRHFPKIYCPKLSPVLIPYSSRIRQLTGRTIHWFCSTQVCKLINSAAHRFNSSLVRQLFFSTALLFRQVTDLTVQWVDKLLPGLSKAGA